MVHDIIRSVNQISQVQKQCYIVCKKTNTCANTLLSWAVSASYRKCEITGTMINNLGFQPKEGGLKLELDKTYLSRSDLKPIMYLGIITNITIKHPRTKLLGNE